MTPEGRVVMYIKRRISKAGGTVRKCSWEGRIAAPDLLVMVAGRHFWIEAKAPGQKPRPTQLREHEVMRKTGGCAVYVCDSEESVDHLLADLGVSGVRL